MPAVEPTRTRDPAPCPEAWERNDLAVFAVTLRFDITVDSQRSFPISHIGLGSGGYSPEFATQTSSPPISDTTLETMSSAWDGSLRSAWTVVPPISEASASAPVSEVW